MSITASPAEWDAVCKVYNMLAEEGAKEYEAATETKKPVDFKANQGILKPRLDLVPLTAMTYIALGLQEGARKYSPASWRDVESVDLAQYIGASMRHIMAYADGEDIDPESGNPHLAHAMASLAIMVELIEKGNGVDTRPAKAGPGPQTLAKYTRTTK